MFQSSGSSLHSAPTSGVELQRRKIKPPETLRSFQDLLTPSPPGGATPSAAGARREEELNSSGEQDGSDDDATTLDVQIPSPLQSPEVRNPSHL